MKTAAQTRLRGFKRIVKKQSGHLRGKGVFGEFKTFIMRGSVLDLAVGVIIGGAFQKIVACVVSDVFMPVLALVTKLINPQGVDFADWFIALDGNHYSTLAAAKEAGAITINYGSLLANVIDFLIIAGVIFLLVKGLNRLSALGKKEEPAQDARVCSFCKMEVAKDALRCPYCTSELEEEKEETQEQKETIQV